MRRKLAELDVDFIGGQDPLTKEEEKAISEYLKSHKLENLQKQNQGKKAIQKRKINA
jgi:hypothetical protein